MRWLSATATAEIDRPIESVWAFVTDLANMPHWVDGVSEPAVAPGLEPSPSGLHPGVPFTSRYTYAGRTHTMHYVVTAFEPPTRYALKSTGGPYPVELTLRLDAAAGGAVRLAKTTRAGSDGRVTSAMFLLLAPLLRRLMRRQIAKELARCKAACEG
jgi:uncharacterized protein YndB with AHSA1/START domain